MAHISANEAKAIRDELKATYGKRFKFSVRRDHYSGVRVTILKGKDDFADILDQHGTSHLNHYYPESYGKHSKLVRDITQIIKSAPAKVEGGRAWYDNSDAMTDYFDTAFYFSINIGDWKKPYERY